MAIKTLMSEEELLSFVLYEELWRFIQSLTNVYKEKLTKRLPGLELTTELESLLFDETGKICDDTIELQEISFKVKGNEKFIRLVVPFGRTDNTYIEFAVGDNETYYSPNEKFGSINVIFSEEVLQAVEDWLSKGWLNAYAHENYTQNY